MPARIATALVGIPAAVFLVFYPGGLPFAVAIGIISIIAALEFYTGVRKIGYKPVEWAGLAAVALFVVSARTYERSTIGAIFPAVLTLLLILSFVVELYRRERQPLQNVGSTIFGAIYVGWMIMHLVVLRGIEGSITVAGYTSEAGAWLVMYVFVCTWACDTGAYFVGRSMGKTKIAPRLSPNKTLEGAIGGFMGSLIVAVGVGYFLFHFAIYQAVALGIIFGLVALLGDLSESAIKREIGIKDTGKIMPGHGGMLDRFDSLLFAGPVMYYFAVLFLANWGK